MNIISKEIEQYIAAHTSGESVVLEQLDRDTHAHVLMSRMISGHVQGRTLSMLSHMIRPRYILEIGTFTGYSAICLAEGLQPGGKLITIDVNEELEDMVKKYFAKAGVENKMEYVIGKALEVLPKLDYTFDLIFIDADKCNYTAYYEMVLPKLRSGGYVIADNVLWSGKVVEENPKDKDLASILHFNKLVQEDHRVENVLLPVRDGLMVARKK